jgi:hypothetical protein
MRLLPLLLTLPLHAADAPEPPKAREAYTLNIELTEQKRNGRAILVAAGKTTLPDGAILRGTLRYRTKDRPVELIPIRKEYVKEGGYEMTFDAGFKESLFPGVYEATIAPDSLAGQPRSLHRQLGRKIRLLKWTGTFDAGGLDEAMKAEQRMRETWRKAILALAPLTDELSKTFERHAAKPVFDDAAWDAWQTDWVSRLRRETAAPSNNALAMILPKLHADWLRPGINPPWVILGHMLHEIGEAACHGRTALRTAPRNAAYVKRVRDIIAYYRQQLALVIRNLPILRPAPAETREIASRLRKDIVALQAWIRAAGRGEAGHAAADWATWSASWRTRMGTDLMRLSEGSLHPELSKATQDYAMACQAMTAAAEQAVSGNAQAPPVDPLVESTLKALDAIVDILAQ